MPLKRAPAVPVPKMPSKKPAAEEVEGAEVGAEVLGAAAATGQPGSGGRAMYIARSCRHRGGRCAQHGARR